MEEITLEATFPTHKFPDQNFDVDKTTLMQKIIWASVGLILLICVPAMAIICFSRSRKGITTSSDLTDKTIADNTIQGGITASYIKVPEDAEL